MQNTTSLAQGPQPRVWVGRWLMLVAVLHTIMAGLLFRRPLMAMAEHGVVNAVGRDPLNMAAAWFLLFGGLLAALALAVTPLERLRQHGTLRLLGAGTLLMCGVGIALMPVSGFWLGLPAGWGMLRKR